MTAEMRAELRRRARSYGERAAQDLRTIRRATNIAVAQGSQCVADRDLAVVAKRAYDNARIAAHWASSLQS